MKKLVALFTLALVVAFATGAYAEVQNVKVGGDIRIRANYSDNIYGTATSWALTEGDGDDWGFINQRTRAIVEADLTDNVSVNATIEADSYWGLSSSFDIRREWKAGFSEAWVQLSELYYTPLSVKVGRQYLNYGRGFIISSAEYEWNFDAVKAVLNFEPWTIDGVYSKLVESFSQDRDIDLWGANVHYAADTWNIEGYVWGVHNRDYIRYVGGYTLTETKLGGYVTDVDLGYVLIGYEVPIKPIVFGIRGDVTPVENLDLWGELAYETGKNVADPYYWTDLTEKDLSAFGTDLGGTYTFPNVAWKPKIGLEWAWGQGDNEDGNFYQMYEYNYWGYAYSPVLSNIHIINANLTVEPIEKLALILDFYHYLQDKKQMMIYGDPWQDNGGVIAYTNGLNKTLGNELDIIAEYDYTEDVSTQLYLAWFWPGDAYEYTTGQDDAYEVRGEIIVSF